MRGSVFEIHISIHGFDRCEGVKAVKASEGIYFPLFGYYILNYYLFPQQAALSYVKFGSAIYAYRPVTAMNLLLAHR
jgi:hypothetical protein